MKAVIERLKAQKLGISPKSSPVQQVVEPPLNPLEQEFDDPDADAEDEEEVIEEKTIAKNTKNTSNTEDKQEPTQEQQIYAEIEMLQNNGRFRAEMLFQLQEINKALVVIAGALVK